MSQALEKFKTLKVMIVIPSTGLWMADFGTSLCNMLAAFSVFRVGEYKQQVALTMNVKGSILPKSRWFAVRDSLKEDVDYLLFVDSDQTFPRKSLHLLLSRRKDVVAANIATKQMPAQPTARNKDPKHPTGWSPVYTDPDSPTLEKVDRIGCGIMLLSKKALQSIHPSHFDMKWIPEVDEIQGEDWSLCTALEKAGIDIWIDHELSNQVGHVGFYTYTHDDVGELPSVRDTQPQSAQKTTAVA